MIWTTEQQDALLNVIQRRNERDILLQRLAQIKTELEKQQHEQAVSHNRWQHEQADVDRLNRLSWASLYHDLLNRKEQQISKEEIESQQAQLRYDMVCAVVDNLQYQVDNQQKRLADFADIDTDYEKLLQMKQAALRSGSGAGHEQYQQHLSNIIQSNHHLQELNEALNAGIQALDEVMHLRELLNQACNWGRWDLIGGSTVSSAIKYSKLDEVREQSYQVTHSLRQFRAEYADLNQTFMADWQFGNNCTRFVDIFIDNIFTDWSVQSRINKALQTAQALENQLVTTLTTLKSQIEQSDKYAKQKANELQRFLEGVG